MYIILFLIFFYGTPTVLTKTLKSNSKTKGYKKLLISLSVKSNNNMHVKTNAAQNKNSYYLQGVIYIFCITLKKRIITILI